VSSGERGLLGLGRRDRSWRVRELYSRDWLRFVGSFVAVIERHRQDCLRYL